jgi:RNA polymerase sigma factor (sigma-70 family)
LTEEQLIQACIQQHAASQKEVFERYSSKMLGVSYRYARSAEDAQDILQEAFIKVFNKIHQYKFEGSFEGWIRKIVVNTALKKYTLSRYKHEVNVHVQSEQEEIFLEPTAYASLTQKEIMDLVNQLPQGYKLVFNLYVVEGYQHEEIAAMLGIQAATSRSQLVKARSMLQKQIIELQKIVA